MGTDTQTPESTAHMLRQVLSQPNACIGFLIGAGCPASIKVKEPDEQEVNLIPTVDELTEKVRNNVPEKLKPYLDLICERLQAQSNNQEDANTPNIEEILNRIRLEREVVRDESDISKQSLDQLEDAVCSTVRDAVKCNLPNNESPFHSLAHWIKHFRSSQPVEVFTTNYDLLIEQALEDTATPYFDGFIGSRKAFFDLDSFEASDLPSSWSKLWKLHGSINWRQYEHHQIVRTSEDDKNTNLIIYPSYMKYSETQKLPFTIMFDKLKEFLRKKSCFLIVLGYSFRDSHINAVLDTSLARNPDLKIIALQYSQLEKYSNAIEIAGKHGNLMVIAKNSSMAGRKTITWQSIENTGDDSEKSHEAPVFELGDFSKLGAFIDEFVVRPYLQTTTAPKEIENEETA